jgi:hypothetical protein
MPIGSGIVYNTGDLILSQVSSSGTAFLETKIAAATSSIVYFDSTARINSASLNSITVGTASYVSGSTSIITNLTASNISASGTGSFGIVGIGTVNPAYKLDVNGNANFTNGFYTNTDASSTSYFVGANGTRPIIFQNNTGASYDFGFKFFDSNTFTIVGGNTLANPTTDLVSFTYDGKVGIGSTVPAYSLDVNGNARVGDSLYVTTATTADAAIEIGRGRSGNGNSYVDLIGDATYTDYGLRLIRSNGGANATSAIAHRGTGTLYFTAVDAAAISFETSNTTRMTITSGGNVGIGTTSINAKLHVVDTSLYAPSLTWDSASAAIIRSENGQLAFGSDTTTPYPIWMQVRTISSTSRPMSLNPLGGNVGIGTTNPVAKLQVAGNISGSSFTSSVSNAVGFLGTASWAQNVVTASYLVPTNSYTITNLTASNISASGTGSFGIVGIGTTSFAYATTNRGVAEIYGSNDGLLALRNSTGNLYIQKTTTDVYINNESNGFIAISNNGSERWRITSTGILQSNGAQTLQTSTGNLTLATAGGNGHILLSPNGSGNVGIGTTSPSTKLAVEGGSVSTVNVTGSDVRYSFDIRTLVGGAIGFNNAASSNVYGAVTGSAYFGVAQSYPIVFTTAGTERMRIESGGNVGIGTTSPNSKLEVAGTAGTAIVSVNNTSVNRSGSFGIDSNGVYIQNSNNGDYFDLKNASGTARFRLVYDNNTYINTTYTSVGSLTQSGSKLSVFGNLSVGSTYGSTAAPSNGAIFQGSVGIGTTSPDSNLHVYSTSFEPAIRLTSTSGSTKTYGLVNNPGWATGSFHIYDFTTDNSRIHISSTGNIGLAVGSTTPANRLDVVGDLRVRAAGAAMILDTATTSDGRMEYKYNGTRKALIGVDSDNLQISADSGNYLQFRTNNTQRMIINNSGGVGIGTSSPLYLVDIYDTGANSAMMSLRSSGSGNARIYFDAANGDLVGSDYCYLGQDDTSLDFVINTSISAGNIHLQPKSGGNNGILYVSGSTRFGRVISQTHEFTGSINLSGSLNATASWANNVVSASYATSAQTANSLNTGNSYTIAGLTNNGTLSQQGTLSMGSGYQILATTGTAPIPGIAFVGDTNTGIYSPGADTIGFSISGSERVRITSDGNVGIGTTAPSNRFEVVGSTFNRASFIATANIQTGIQIKRTGGSNTDWELYAPASSTDLRIFNGTDLVTFQSGSGNVGIGTTNPSAKLQVISGNNTGISLFSNNSGQYAYQQIGRTSSELELGVVGGANQFFTGTVAGDAVIKQNSTGKIHLGYGSASPSITINSSNNVGIGTTTPVARLTVTPSGSAFDSTNALVGYFGKLTANGYGSSFIRIARSDSTTSTGSNAEYTDIEYNSGGAGPFRYGTFSDTNIINGNSATAGTYGNINFVTSGSIRMIIGGGTNAGNVGIGTTNPTDKFTVYGALASYKTGADTIQTQVYLANTPNTRAFNLQLNSGGTGLDLWSYNSSNAWLKHTTFDYDGRVGIGTAAPAAKLEISGSSNSALLHVKSPISGAILYVSGSGAVGIGTSNVGAYTLQVNGSFAATTKSFVIDHPTKAGKRLIYGSLESPYHGIRLTGRDTLVNGKCKVQLPDYIYKLILHDSVNIQLTGIKCNKTLYVDDINVPENYFTIAYDKAMFETYKDYDFFWDFTAIRADVPELNTEL